MSTVWVNIAPDNLLKSYRIIFDIKPGSLGGDSKDDEKKNLKTSHVTRKYLIQNLNFNNHTARLA